MKVSTKLFFASFAVLCGSIFFHGSAKAAPCFGQTGGLTDAPISNVFPRPSAIKNRSSPIFDGFGNQIGCNGANSGHIYLTSFFATTTNGSPGVTLNTPNASLNVFFIGNPGPASAVNVDILVGFCMFGGNPNNVYISYGAGFDVQTGAGWKTITLNGSDFSDVSSHYGQIDTGGGVLVPIYKYNWSIDLSVDIDQPRNCEVYTGVNNGALITFAEDSSPTAVYGADTLRYNQQNFGWGLGVPRRIVPNGSPRGAYALRTLSTYTNGIEYTFPFAASCDFTGSSVILRVYDADAPSPSNPPGTENGSYDGIDYYPKMEVWEYDSSGNYIGTIDPTGNSNSVAVGNDEYGEYSLPIVSGHKYVWHWWNVSARNGLQIWMPFSEISARPGAVCPPPNTAPQIAFALSCDPAGSVSYVNPRVWDQQAGSLTVTGAASLSVGVGAGVWTPIAPAAFAGIRDNTPHSVTLNVADAGPGAALSGSFTTTYTCAFPPPTFTCNAAVFNSATTLEPGETFSPRMVVSTAGSPALAAPVNVTVVFTVVGVVGSSRTGQVTPLANGATATIGVGAPPIVATVPNTPITLPSPGQYTATALVTYVTTDSVYSGACNGGAPLTTLITVAAKPYFKVLGGDIISTTSTGQVRGWNKIGENYTGPGAVNDNGANGGRSGAGVQGIIVAAGVVNGVASGIMLPSYGSPQDMTFANSNAASPPRDLVYGGGFGAAVLKPVTVSATAAWTNASKQNGNFLYNTAIPTARFPGPTPGNGNIAGTRMTVFVTSGDLLIDGNIVYAGPYASLAAIPHIKFVVTNGNINIQPNVSQIDAELIAPNGTIDTCYTALANKYDACAQSPSTTTLVVNGSLHANKIRPNRLIGTLRQSTQADATGGPAYVNIGNIGEIFQFTPELYLATPAEPATVPLGNRFDAMTALPPLF